MNDEKRHKRRETTIYYSLIFAAGIMVVVGSILFGIDTGLIPPGLAEMLYALSVIVIGPFFFVVFGVSLFLQVRGLFTCSSLLRRHLLLWYGCLILLILIVPSIVPVKPAAYIYLFGILILLILPVIWVKNASRS